MNLPAMKAALTRAKKSQNPQTIIEACDSAFSIFDAEGYSDCWHTWNIARQDAQFDLQYDRHYGAS